MTDRAQINNALLSAISEKAEIEDQVLEDYGKLNEKCEKLINKIKVRKTKSIRPPVK